jgi:hypothetical protein
MIKKVSGVRFRVSGKKIKAYGLGSPEAGKLGSLKFLSFPASSPLTMGYELSAMS